MKNVKIISAAVLILLVFSTLLIGFNFVSANKSDGVTLKFDLKQQKQLIESKFSVVNSWTLPSPNLDLPKNWVKTNYPYTEYVQLMTATGGSESRDLFVNPNDRSTLTDYKFDSLISACHAVIDQGLKPYIVTGNVPLKLSSEPKIGSAYGVNVRPPDDYNQYYTYIKAIADALKAEFGVNEIKSWMWGVLTEYENTDWFEAKDGKPESTSVAYYKLYDYTVAALQDSIGADNLRIGAHSMSFSAGNRFLDHCAIEKNYKTGKTGTQLNFLNISYYDRSPGVGGASLSNNISQLQGRAYSVMYMMSGYAGTIKDLTFGVDEGRILGDSSGKPLGQRAVGFSWQGAYDAKLFKTMVESNIDYFSTWGLNTGGLLESTGINTVSSHISNLSSKLLGDKAVFPIKTGTPAYAKDEVDGIGGFDSKSGTLNLMMYNYNDNLNSDISEHATIDINNIKPINGTTVSVRKWIVDDTHGNFYPTWWNDMKTNGITESAFDGWSSQSTNLPGMLSSQKAIDLWNSKQSDYKLLAELTYTDTDGKVTNDTLTLDNTLDHHGVVFYQITNVAIGNSPKPTTTPTPKPSNVKVKVSGKDVKFKYLPKIVSNIVMAQADALTAALKAKYKYDSKAKTITITKSKTSIFLKIGSKTAKVGCKSVKMITAPKVYGVPFIPIKFVSEKLGYKYSYNINTKTVSISVSK